jgi:fermentation-respiration switch protein FrsA (DUF1100 family)
MATVVIHLLDGGFLHNAPGTSAGDHVGTRDLTAGLAILVMLVWPFVWPAARAALALSLGALAVAAGAITHGAAAISEGVSVADVSGIAMTAGGVLLVALGGVLTLRTMQKPARRDLRWAGRRALVAVTGLAVIYYILIPLVIAVWVTHPRQAGVARIDLGVPYEDVTFTTVEGLRLAGWFVPSRNGATIIALPGANNDRTNVAEHAAMLARHGYGVLLFDPRGNGESEGDPNQFGWHTGKDIRAALDFLRGRPDVDPTRIGALGLSMGGEAVLQATAQNAAIRAVVAEGAGARSVDEVLLQPGVAKWVSLPQTWLTYAATGALSRVAPPMSLKDLTPLIAPRPLLLIYASGSHQAGESQLNPIYFEAAGGPKELWAIPDAGHTEGLAAHPDDYEARVIGFFDRALLERTE